MRTVTVELSEAAIKKYSADLSVRELNDVSLPLRLRFLSDRSARWYLVNYEKGKAKWLQLGKWPLISFKQAKLKMTAQLADLSKPVCSGVFDQAGDVLRWYVERATADKSLSNKRKASLRSALKNQLLPCIDELLISEISSDVIDEFFFMPLQSDYALSSVRNWFAMVKVAFRRAARLRKITSDPMAEILFSDFTKAKILPRSSALTISNVPSLLSDFDSQEFVPRVFCWLLLVFGTRIGETRLSTWNDIDFRKKTWFIPAKNTKTKQALILPLDDFTVSLLKSFYNWQTQHGWRMVCVFSSERNPMNHVVANELIQSVSGRLWTAHHLRKLARSCWMDMGIDYMTCEFLLNHKKDKMDATYIHTHAEALKRDAIEKWVAFLLSEKPRQHQDAAA